MECTQRNFREAQITLKISILDAVSKPRIAAGACAALAGGAAVLLHVTAGEAGSAPRIFGGNRPAHIIVIVQENRTFDNLFNGYPGANSRNYGYDSQGKIVRLREVSLATTYDLDHSHTGFETEWADGKMNGFDKVRTSGVGSKKADLAYTYAPYSEVKPYWDLAEQFALADGLFQTNEGPSFPAHQYLIAGQSGHFSAANPDPLDPADRGPFAMSENIPAPKANQAGCDAALAGYRDQTIDLSLRANPQPSNENAPVVRPCVNYATILDELDAKSLTWHYYTPSYGTLWDAPDAIGHIRFRAGLWANVKVPETTIFSDIALHQLANVSYVIPRGSLSDHPGGTTALGPDWVASVVNAVGQSSYWHDTAVIVTWDDWGGFYDHVPPTVRNAYNDGFRVPALIISPYSKRGYVSHVHRDFGSILRFIEANFKLPSLGESDEYNDDLSDCFDFLRPPHPYIPVITAAGFDAKTLQRLPPDSSPVDDQ
jgi:phospholipase C